MPFSFFPRTVYSVESPVNGRIRVVDRFGRRSLKIGGLEQSGPMVKSIWRQALKKVKGGDSGIKNCLVLGLGGGTLVHLLKKRWPNSRVTAVELDPEVVRIGRHFFGLGAIKGLEIVVADAVRYISRPGLPRRYSLVAVDLYLGERFPAEAESGPFRERLKKLLAPGGVVIFNRLRSENLKKFERNLRNSFQEVSLVKTPANLFFLAGP